MPFTLYTVAPQPLTPAESTAFILTVIVCPDEIEVGVTVRFEITGPELSAVVETFTDFVNCTPLLTKSIFTVKVLPGAGDDNSENPKKPPLAQFFTDVVGKATLSDVYPPPALGTCLPYQVDAPVNQISEDGDIAQNSKRSRAASFLATRISSPVILVHRLFLLFADKVQSTFDAVIVKVPIVNQLLAFPAASRAIA